jgi:hypothetical protein
MVEIRRKSRQTEWKGGNHNRCRLRFRGLITRNEFTFANVDYYSLTPVW